MMKYDISNYIKALRDAYNRFENSNKTKTDFEDFLCYIQQGSGTNKVRVEAIREIEIKYIQQILDEMKTKLNDVGIILYNETLFKMLLCKQRDDLILVFELL